MYWAMHFDERRRKSASPAFGGIQHNARLRLKRWRGLFWCGRTAIGSMTQWPRRPSLIILFLLHALQQRGRCAADGRACSGFAAEARGWPIYIYIYIYISAGPSGTPGWMPDAGVCMSYDAVLQALSSNVVKAQMFEYAPNPRPGWKVYPFLPYLWLVRYGLGWLGRRAAQLGWHNLATWLRHHRARLLLRWHSWATGYGRGWPWGRPWSQPDQQRHPPPW